MYPFHGTFYFPCHDNQVEGMKGLFCKSRAMWGKLNCPRFKMAVGTGIWTLLPSTNYPGLYRLTITLISPTPSSNIHREQNPPIPSCNIHREQNPQLICRRLWQWGSIIIRSDKSKGTYGSHITARSVALKIYIFTATGTSWNTGSSKPSYSRASL